jgi:hypothetical protein
MRRIFEVAARASDSENLPLPLFAKRGIGGVEDLPFVLRACSEFIEGLSKHERSFSAGSC